MTLQHHINKAIAQYTTQARNIVYKPIYSLQNNTLIVEPCETSTIHPSEAYTFEIDLACPDCINVYAPSNISKSDLIILKDKIYIEIDEV